MHMGVVPMRDGKLSSKAMFDREELLKIQDDLPKYMREQGFEIERGARNSEAKHLTVAEFKQEMAYKEIESELVVDYGAPQFMNTNTGEFMTPKEVEEAQSIGELFGDKFELNMRETSFEEKLDWVKNKQNLELKRLDELKNRWKKKSKAWSLCSMKSTKNYLKSILRCLRASLSSLRPRSI